MCHTSRCFVPCLIRKTEATLHILNRGNRIQETEQSGKSWKREERTSELNQRLVIAKSCSHLQAWRSKWENVKGPWSPYHWGFWSTHRWCCWNHIHDSAESQEPKGVQIEHCYYQSKGHRCFVEEAAGAWLPGKEARSLDLPTTTTTSATLPEA